MATDNLEKAREIYRLITRTMDEENWKYSGDESKLSLSSAARGDDIPIDLHIDIDPDRQFITLLSLLPFTTPEDKRLEMAIAISKINYMLVDGCFDYDIKNGRTFFRMTINYRGSRLGRDLIMYMLLVSCQTVDDYNDTLLLLVKGIISLDAFLKKIDED